MLRVDITLALLLLQLCRTSSLHSPPPARAAVLATRLLPSSAPRRACCALMSPKKAAARPAEEDPSAGEAAAADEDDDNDNPFSSRPRLVDPMTTSLGREKELQPFPGPPIVEDIETVPDSRPLFASVNFFTPSHMPSEELQTAYMDWLADGSGDRICMPHYLLSAGSFEDVLDTMGAPRRAHRRTPRPPLLVKRAHVHVRACMRSPPHGIAPPRPPLAHARSLACARQATC